jgi:hypothetical protein
MTENIIPIHKLSETMFEILELARQADARSWAIFTLALNHGCS